MPRSQFIGIWSWQIGRNRVTADVDVARSFSIDPRQAENGLALQEYLKSVHPEDLPLLIRSLDKSVADGSEFQVIYRVLKRDAEMRVLARGRLQETVDDTQRLSGVLISIGKDSPIDPELSREGTDIRLGLRELQCLEWCSRGKTNWEIGQILGITERTVEHHIASATRKMASVTRAQAVAEALRSRLI